VVLHRWLGVAFCVLFAIWFFSGIVMMYWTYPEVSAADRLARAEVLDSLSARITPATAFASLDVPKTPSRVTLEIFEHRPAYRFRLGRSTERLVFADTGEPVPDVTQDLARHIAASWTGQPEAAARFDGVIDAEDQWTVSGAFRSLRPLFKFAWPNGEEVYVSSVSGQVEQFTTRATRVAAYFGAIPHWMYFTPLRKNGVLWSKVVIWASGIATAAAVLGLIVAVWIALPAKRIPYAGVKRWHTILGLCFGLIASTWSFSGMLSMDPFPIEGDDDSGLAISQALRGGKLDIKAFDAKNPGEALQQLGIALRVKQIELGTFDGRPVYTLRESPAEMRIVPVAGAPMTEFEYAHVFDIAAMAVAPVAVAERRVVTSYDAYYLDRQHQRPLPVLFMRLNNPQQSMYYIDPKTARIVASYTSGGRLNRWLYHGLHSMDLPWLYAHRPAWDIVVLVLMLGGAALSVTSLILAIQFLKRKLRTA
jgi:hypothetical protein